MPYDQLYPPMARSPRTELDGAIDSSVTTFSVINGALLPSAPNTATIGLGEDSETVLYETLTGNILSDITRGFDPPGSQKGWDDQTPIARVLTQQDIVALGAGVDANAGSLLVDEGKFTAINSFLANGVTQLVRGTSTTEISTVETVSWVDTLLFAMIAPKSNNSIILVFVNSGGKIYLTGAASNIRTMDTRVYESVTDTEIIGRVHGLLVPASLNSEEWTHDFPIIHLGTFQNDDYDTKTFKLQFRSGYDENYCGIMNTASSPGIIILAEVSSLNL